MQAPHGHAYGTLAGHAPPRGGGGPGGNGCLPAPTPKPEVQTKEELLSLTRSNLLQEPVLVPDSRTSIMSNVAPNFSVQDYAPEGDDAAVRLRAKVRRRTDVTS